jgi:homoserine dehydrogenase
VADILAREPLAGRNTARITGALVRRVRSSPAQGAFPVCTEPAELLDNAPDVLIEVLGGLEPARTLVLEALARGIPVVTANKSLLAVHGDELFAAASRFETPLRCEAAVLAGVPFLGTFGNRPLATAVDRITGIFNGTSNFVLSRVEDGLAAADALADARRRGFAEPDSSRDLDGSDSADKLAILIRFFARLSVQPADIPRTSISGIGPAELARARELGGRLKPVAFAEWSDNVVTCFTGPAFLPDDDPLAVLRGVLNGMRIERDGSLPLHFTGPGAGPEVTARTILDDVVEVLADRRVPALGGEPRARVSTPSARGWYVTLHSGALADPVDIADLLGSYGIWVRRWGAAHWESGGTARSLLTFPCSSNEVERALRAVVAASGCSTRVHPMVEAAHV